MFGIKILTKLFLFFALAIISPLMANAQLNNKQSSDQSSFKFLTLHSFYFTDISIASIFKNQKVTLKPTLKFSEIYSLNINPFVIKPYPLAKTLEFNFDCKLTNLEGSTCLNGLWVSFKTLQNFNRDTTSTPIQGGAIYTETINILGGIGLNYFKKINRVLYLNFYSYQTIYQGTVTKKLGASKSSFGKISLLWIFEYN